MGEEWRLKMGETALPEGAVDALVMDYLAREGYADAASAFAEEARQPPPHDSTHLEMRGSIIQHLNDGQCEAAAAKLNELDPELLDRNQSVAFALKLQNLIELVRGGDLAGSLEYAHEEVVPLCEKEPEYLEQLEQVMTLLAFPDKDSPVGHLLDEAERRRVASFVNRSIVTSLGDASDSKLVELFRLLESAQEKGSVQDPSIPHVTNLISAEPLVDMELGPVNRSRS
eukprot:CAMPEP_0119124384 /NCGR_PEP_ID=MMETSP1310-20130426/4027_1 /TAXON_ID=464262 /ORGANISM="Genus nov. species nov., Strain RCC2339" /LENGTH=227 /DNA_ID=CAMNT_0007114331 /DNA_START=379 /DNA_END=1062 /DNA_ORIENTATION=-